MEKKETKPKARPYVPTESVCPIDVRPGDLIQTAAHPEGVAVISSDLVEPGHVKGKLHRNRKHEWWITIAWTDHQGRVSKQTERFKTGKFSEKVVKRVLLDDYGCASPRCPQNIRAMGQT